MSNGKNGLSIGLRNAVTVATLLAMLLSVVAWGLKLEGKADRLEERVSTLESQVGEGVLPRAEERISDLERRLNKLEK